ncbi:MAG: hypothetical protein ACQERC_05175 [Bacteroidota bacterium]
MKDWIKKWYNRRFNDIDEAPSSEVWENISKDLDGWPKHWYRENADDLHTPPRYSIWEGISQSLTPGRGMRPLFNRWAWLILPVFFFVPHLLQHDTSTEQGATVISKFMDEFAGKRTIASVESPMDDFTKNEETPHQVKKSGISSQSEQADEKSDRIRSGIQESAENLESSSVKRDEVEKEVLSVNFDREALEQSDRVANDKVESPVRRLKPLGLTDIPLSSIRDWDELSASGESNRHTFLSINVLPQLSWLDNTLTRTARKDQLSSVESSASLGFALAIDQQIKDKHGIHIQTTLNNRKSVRIQSSESLSKNIDLNYHSLDVMYTYDWKAVDALGGLSIQPRVGLFAGYLTNVQATSGNERIKTLEDGFGKWDMGASFGVAFLKNINENWQLNTSVNNQWGTFNVFKGNQDIPANYFSTYAHALQLSFGIARKL